MTPDVFNKERKPRFHGNGFIQLYITNRTRLHIWTPELEPIRDHNATIHTHRYDMESTVLEGVLKHTTFDVIDAHPRALPTCQIVNLTGASEVRSAPGEFDPATYRHNVRHEYWFTAGSRYTFKEGLFHDSENGHDGLTATVFTKVGEDAPDFAKILMVGEHVQRGAISTTVFPSQPTHAFDPATQPPQEKMWDIINSVVVRHAGQIATLLEESCDVSHPLRMSRS